MKKFMAQYKNENKDKFNNKLIYGMREEPLIPYIVDIFKNLESIPYIKFLGYEYEDDYTKMDLNKIDKKMSKSKTNPDIKLMNITDSYLGKITIKLKISTENESLIKEIGILLPERYKTYYYYLNGKKFYPVYQLVENSTYSTRDSVILKSVLLPIIVHREMITVEDNVLVSTFYLNLFNKTINLLLFYFCEFGYEGTLKYFNIDSNIFKIVDKYDLNMTNQDGYHIIKRKKFKYAILVDNDYFEKSQFIHDFAYTLHQLLIEYRTSFKLSKLDNKVFWLKMLGSLFIKTENKQMKKGLDAVISFKRILDNTTQRNLKLYKHNKTDIFAVTRWMLTNFSSLKKKSGIDLINKRLRMNEYIASYLAKEISKKVNRILAQDRVSLDYMERQFNMKQDILITELQTSPLLRFDDTVNDMDILGALKYSIKGPSSLGEKNSRSINIKYKAIHPSQIGKIDVNTTSTSSPGIVGQIVPFIKMDGLYFDGSMEDQSWDYRFYKIKKEIKDNKGYHPFMEFNIETEEEYNKMIELADELKNKFTVKVKKNKMIVSDKKYYNIKI